MNTPENYNPNPIAPMRTTIHFGEQKYADFVYEQARLFHGGMVSQFIQELIRRAMRPEAANTGNLLHMFGRARDIAERVGVEAALVPNATDIVLPQYGVGVEFKSKFNLTTGEAKMIAAMGYAHGQAGCTKFWIVTADDMGQQDVARFKAIAQSFPYGQISVFPFSELERRIGELKRA